MQEYVEMETVEHKLCVTPRNAAEKHALNCYNKLY